MKSRAFLALIVLAVGCPLATPANGADKFCVQNNTRERIIAYVRVHSDAKAKARWGGAEVTPRGGWTVFHLTKAENYDVRVLVYTDANHVDEFALDNIPLRTLDCHTGVKSLKWRKAGKQVYDGREWRELTIFDEVFGETTVGCMNDIPCLAYDPSRPIKVPPGT